MFRCYQSIVIHEKSPLMFIRLNETFNENKEK